MGQSADVDAFIHSQLNALSALTGMRAEEVAALVRDALAALTANLDELLVQARSGLAEAQAARSALRTWLDQRLAELKPHAE